MAVLSLAIATFFGTTLSVLFSDRTIFFFQQISISISIYMLSASASPRMYYVHMFMNKGTLQELPEEMVHFNSDGNPHSYLSPVCRFF